MEIVNHFSERHALNLDLFLQGELRKKALGVGSTFIFISATRLTNTLISIQQFSFPAYLAIGKVNVIPSATVSFKFTAYCERRYFRVYKFSRISENWQFRADLYSRF